MHTAPLSISNAMTWSACAAFAVIIFTASPAQAYRPFDGTDAAVADVGEVEIELQPVGKLTAG